MVTWNRSYPAGRRQPQSQPKLLTHLAEFNEVLLSADHVAAGAILSPDNTHPSILIDPALASTVTTYVRR